MTPQTKAHLALFSTNLFFAINYTGIKFLTQYGITGPFGLNFLRVAVSAILFWLLFLFRKRKISIQKKDLAMLALCAFAAIAANQMLFIKGLSLSSPLHASLLVLLSPILISVFAVFYLREKMSLINVAGLVLAFSGAVVLLSGKQAMNPGDNTLLGDLLVIGSTVAYSWYFILVKPLMEKYSPIMVTRWMFTFGLLMIWPFCITELREIDFPGLRFTDWLILAAIIVPGTFLAYIFNVYGIKILSASVAGTYIYTQPILTGLIATIFIQEKITLVKIIAAVLIFGGLYLAGLHGQKKMNPRTT